MKKTTRGMKTISRAALLSLVCILAAPDLPARIDKKFYDKAANLVRGTRSELFDPNVAIADSIAERESAVVIAEYVGINVDYEYYQNAMHSANISKRKYFTRRMLKLLDDAAVERFSEFEFGERVKVTDIVQLPVAKVETAFGARVYKPDGSMSEVDLSTALPITKGKKGSEKDALSYRIAVPNLAPGDVIEYFNYTEEWVDEYSLPEISLYFSQPYPVLDYMVEGVFSPEITVEYHSYNGAPEFAHGLSADGKKNTLTLRLSDIPVLTDEEGLRPARQLPFIELQTLNNTSKYVFRPRNARRGGVYANLQPLTIFGDISNVLSRSSYEGSKIPGKARKLAGDYLKAHPDATPAEKRDAAWLASVYTSLTGKESIDRFWLSIIFRDMLERMKLTEDLASAPEVGFVSSRLEVPTSEISSWKGPDYVCIVDKDIYMIPPSYHYAPREMPGDYQGEQGGKFASKAVEGGRRAYAVAPSEFAVATTRARDNGMTLRLNGRIAEDGRSLTVGHDFSFAGSAKAAAGDVTCLQEWAREVEAYLGIAAGKGYKDAEYDEAERAKEMTESLEAFAEEFFREKPADMENVEIHSRGVTPDSRSLRFSFDATHHDMVSDIGGGEAVMLNLGRLVANMPRFEGTVRSRMLEFYRSSPVMNRYEINLAIPEGYAVDMESVDKFMTNVKNRHGSFFAKCNVADDGRSISVQVAERYDGYMVEPEKWDELLEIFDTAARFNDASLMLVKQ